MMAFAQIVLHSVKRDRRFNICYVFGPSLTPDIGEGLACLCCFHILNNIEQ